MARLGIFGGTFDPVHYGHLLLAEFCLEECSLDEVWIMPAATSPHKPPNSAAPASCRMEMLELAVAGHPKLRATPLELDRGGISYTFETLQRIDEDHPGSELFLLLGADSLADLPSWKEPQKICELAVPVAVSRVGSSDPDYDGLIGSATAERLEYFRQFRVTMPLVELSSTAIRRRVSESKSIRYQLPRAVEKYIETRQLYRS